MMFQFTASDQQWRLLTSQVREGGRGQGVPASDWEQERSSPRMGIQHHKIMTRYLMTPDLIQPGIAHRNIGLRRSLTGRPHWIRGGDTLKVMIRFGLTVSSTPELCIEIVSVLDLMAGFIRITKGKFLGSIITSSCPTQISMNYKLSRPDYRFIIYYQD